MNGGAGQESPSPPGAGLKYFHGSRVFPDCFTGTGALCCCECGGWLSQMAVAEQVSCKAPLKRGESRERSEGMAAVFQARHAQAATQVHFSSGCTWPLLESKISLTTQGLKTVIM